MNRCTRSRARIAGIAIAALAGLFLAHPPVVSAQTLVREAPKDVKPGRMVVTLPPVITIDGKPDRLSPGARIRNLNNMLLLSGSVVGQELPVVYRRDSAGLVHEVWLLTADEYSRLGGTNTGDADGYKRFVELLNIIFSLRK